MAVQNEGRKCRSRAMDPGPMDPTESLSCIFLCSFWQTLLMIIASLDICLALSQQLFWRALLSQPIESVALLIEQIKPQLLQSGLPPWARSSFPTEGGGAASVTSVDAGFSKAAHWYAGGRLLHFFAERESFCFIEATSIQRLFYICFCLAL